MNDEQPLGRTIRIYLADGNPTGIQHAELVNWTIQAIVCPRRRVPVLSRWPEARRPGAYILVGADGDGDLAYIGETEDVATRLQHHVAKKEFWRQAVFVTSKDDNLTKAHVKYLESRFLSLATDAARIRLENGKGSEPPNLPKPDRDAMEEYIQSARILLSALGFRFLEKLDTRSEPKHAPASGEENGGTLRPRLTMTVPKTGVNAKGSVTDEGFVVLEGSKGSAVVRDSLPKGWRALREEAISDGAITDEGGGLVFRRDMLFSSPSAAASVLAGGNRNGRDAWVADDGRTLKAIEEAQAEEEQDPTSEDSGRVDDED